MHKAQRTFWTSSQPQKESDRAGKVSRLPQKSENQKLEKEKMLQNESHQSI